MATMMIHAPSITFGKFGTIVTFPNGEWIGVEVLTQPAEMACGMMNRPTFPEGRAGVLFAHEHPGFYRYTMENVYIPLDIIWLSPDQKIVRMISAYPDQIDLGGKELSQYVLEIAGGEAQRLGLRIGDTLQW